MIQVGDKVRRKPTVRENYSAYRPIGVVDQIDVVQDEFGYRRVRVAFGKHVVRYRWKHPNELELVEAAKSADDSLGTVNPTP